MKPQILLFSCLLMLAACETPSPPPEEVEAVQPQPAQTVEPEERELQSTTEETEPEEFVVTEEIYTKTFDEIEELIRNLNEIIQNEDYQSWLMYLSNAYVEKTSNPEYLKEQSQTPLLRKNKVKLKHLQDYFNYVVVPSRTQAKLDEIEFIDETKIKAYAMIGNTRALLYLLVREDSKWKIGVR
jgi:hypothetical protein